MPTHPDNWLRWTAPALRAVLLVAFLLVGTGCGGSVPAPRLGLLDLPDAKQLPALPDNPKPADYDARISALTALLARENADKILAQARDRQRELDAWRSWTRWISAVVIPLAVAGAALAIWFGVGSLGVPVAGAAILAALALQAWAEYQAFLLAALVACAVLGAVVGVIALLRRDRATVAGAKVGDLVEAGRSEIEVMAAKVDAEAAQLAAGIFAKVQRARGKPPIPKAKREAA